MAKFLGIDYGSKKIGLAVSDEAGTFAFPLHIIKSNDKALAEIAKVAVENKIDIVILGLPLDLAGAPNKIMEEVGYFKKNLENKLGLKVHFEKEFMTSSAALHMNQYMKGIRPNTARKVKREPETVDASAAALILQRYLDKQHHVI
jgi:putative Holliday junction resolvase